MENVWRIKKDWTIYLLQGYLHFKQEEEKVFSFGNWNQTNGTNQLKSQKK